MSGPRAQALTCRAAVAVGLAATVLLAPGLAAGRAAAAPAAPATPASATLAAQTASGTAAVIPAPRHTGTLRITGALRDGGSVHAAGLSWRPGRLRPGQRLLSFAVGYSWKSCATAASCRTAADTGPAPFAARNYLVGHADAGRRLRLTETATEVVETNPATFAFSAVSASVTVTTGRTAGQYPAGRPPATEFRTGTPEARTASNSEYFQVSAPHFAAADGQPSMQYRFDTRPWRTVPASLVLYTGLLRTGQHELAVRTANRAGTTTLRFSWRVIPMPAPVACTGWWGHPCWYPPHLNSAGKPMRWDWQIGRVVPLQRTGARAVDIYDVDGFLTTPAQVRQIHRHWQAATLAHPKLICYIDLAWEDYRPDGSPGQYFPAATLGNVYYGYPQERWVDFRQLDALKPMLDRRIAMCARKGFDAVELDDIDSFDPPGTTGFRLTPGDAQNYLAYAFNEIHRYGMTGLWKNSPLLTWWARNYTDGAVVEECYVYKQCLASQLRGSSQYGMTCTTLQGRTPCGWDVFTTDKTAQQPTGKWVGEAEYSADGFVCNPGQSCKGRHSFAAFCQAVYSPSYGFAAVKFNVNLDGSMFYPCPKGT
jgi:hypothetical protein